MLVLNVMDCTGTQSHRFVLPVFNLIDLYCQTYSSHRFVALILNLIDLYQLVLIHMGSSVDTTLLYIVQITCSTCIHA